MIPLDGKQTEFSALLLRDLCQCPLCVHESTRQKLYSTADIPGDIKARSVEADANSGTVSILWDRDAPGFDTEHRTELSSGSLRHIATAGVLPGPYRDSFETHRIWDQSPALPDFDYEAYMHDDETLYHAITQLQRHGLLFVKNVPGIEKSVSTIAERIGPVKDTFYGYTWDGE